MSEFWAKPDQPYHEHIEKTYNIWKQVVKAKSKQIERLADLNGFTPERFLVGSLLTVVLHDIGKLCIPFQKMMEAKRQNKFYDLDENYRHELVSFPFVWLVAQRLSGLLVNGKQGKGLPLEALAVVGHHKNLDSELNSFERERTYGNVEIDWEGIELAFDLASEIFEKEGYTFPRVNPNARLSESYYSFLNKFIGLEGCFYELFDESKTEAVRNTYLLLKAILHYADWYASGDFDLNDNPKYSPKYSRSDLENNLRRHCIDNDIQFDGLNEFQQKLAATKGDVIAVAPTGSGKTEAALLWARRNLDEMGGGKILYLLPTTVTSNSIYERLQKYLGRDNVGLAHSRSICFLKEKEEEEPDNIKNILFCKSLIYPVSVATVDQLLTSGFNFRHWTIKEANAAHSVIIIDEIHAYDSWTLGLIQHTIEHLSKLGARFLLMSATMPSFLVSLFQKALPKSAIIRDTQLLNRSRSRYILENQPLEESLKLIEEYVEEGKKVLVVVNTVARCQEIYQSLKEKHLDPICYHSKFILRDRNSKEKEIEKAHLLVATQVVEVSLDIDFDILFTECAPPDAIAQRAGRINRRRCTKPGGKVHLFPASEISRRIYDHNATGMLDKTWEVFRQAPENITEQDLINVVEQVYSGMDITDERDYQEAYSQYKKTQRRLNGIMDNVMREEQAEVTRQVKYLQVAVIPVKFKAEFLKTVKAYQRQAFELKVPAWYARKYTDSYEKGVTFCRIDYSYEIGAQQIKKNDENDPVSYFV